MSDNATLISETLGQFQLLERIGGGGMGDVYRAQQLNLPRQVAVKVLLTRLSNNPGLLERFDREAATASTLEHPHIIPIYDYGTQRGISYLVMRLVTGGTLAERIQQRRDEGKLPSLGEISELLNRAASGLDYAHGQGVIHRDIKANNIMFDNQGTLYITDFGIARLAEATSALTGTNQMLGTPSHMSPEQWTNQAVTPATDQYALGVMIYGLVAGRLPFESDTPYGIMHKHINEQPTPLYSLRPDVPEAVALVLNRAMAKTASERFPTVTAFAQAFAGTVTSQQRQETGFFTFKLSRGYAVESHAPSRTPSRTPLAAPTGAPPEIPTTPGHLTAGMPAAPLLTPPATRRPLVWAGVGAVLLVLIAMIAVVIARLPPDAQVDENAALALRQTRIAVAYTETAINASAALTATATSPLPSLSPVPSAESEPLSVAVLPSATDTLSATPESTLIPTLAADVSAVIETPRVPTSTLSAAVLAMSQSAPTAAPPLTAINTPEPTTPLPRVTNTTLPTNTVTNTPPPTPTHTSSPTPLPPTATRTPLPTTTNTPVPTRTPSPTPLPPTRTPTHTPLPTTTNTPVPTRTPSPTPLPPTLTPTRTSSPTATFTPDPLQVIYDQAAAFDDASGNAGWTPIVQNFDGVPMVLVPPGCFMMGSDAFEQEQPVHEQCFDAPFWIDQTEVTQVDFMRLGGVQANTSTFVGEQRPVENITWFEARDFCLRRGAHLPTEREWEYAGRGVDGLIYPWGDTWDANLTVQTRSMEQGTANVGSIAAGASWVGALDMSGNLWEWLSSLNAPYPYDAADGRESDIEQGADVQMLLRGGSWGTNLMDGFRISYRLPVSPAYSYLDIGFRCARTAGA